MPLVVESPTVEERPSTWPPPAPESGSHPGDERFALLRELGERSLDIKAALAGLGIAEADTPPPAAPQAPAVRPSAQIVPLADRITGKDITYDAIVDLMLLSPPGTTQGAIARQIGYSQSWLSRIIASDAFQTRLAERLEKDVEPERRAIYKARFAGIEEEARGILLLSLKKLSARLEDPTGVPDELIIKGGAMTSKLLGYGARTLARDPPSEVHMHLHLERLANNLRSLNRAPVASEAEIIEEKPAL